VFPLFFWAVYKFHASSPKGQTRRTGLVRKDAASCFRADYAFLRDKSLHSFIHVCFCWALLPAWLSSRFPAPAGPCRHPALLLWLLFVLTWPLLEIIMPSDKEQLWDWTANLWGPAVCCRAFGYRNSCSSQAGETQSAHYDSGICILLCILFGLLRIICRRYIFFPHYKCEQTFVDIVLMSKTPQ